MGKARVLSAEFGMSTSLGGKVYKVVGAESSTLDFSDLIFAANNDAMAFISLYHLGLHHNSTFIWLPTHSIEKFLKAYLLVSPNYSEKILKNIGHNIKKLWIEYKKAYQFNNITNVEEYIDEISNINPDVRYGDKSVCLNDNLLSGFVLLLVNFNKFKRGSTNYPNSYYGFFDEELSNINLISDKYLVGIFKAYLHLIIEHQITISPMGICHPHKYVEIKLFKQNRIDELCPFCNNFALLDLNQTGLTNKNACEKTREYINKMSQIK